MLEKAAQLKRMTVFPRASIRVSLQVMYYSRSVIERKRLGDPRRLPMVTNLVILSTLVFRRTIGYPFRAHLTLDSN